MKGFVPTPPQVADRMVEKLFRARVPTRRDKVLDPGCGTGVFIEAIMRWCDDRVLHPPMIVGIEADPGRAFSAAERFKGMPHVEIRQADFLSSSEEEFDYIIGNPPYVSITGLTEEERERYRARYRTATNRFDLYALFIEQALQQLRSGGRLVFITPEKFLYVESAASLRRVLAEASVDELHFFAEDTFADLVTYPLVTTVTKRGGNKTTVIARDGTTSSVRLRGDGLTWLPAVTNALPYYGATLSSLAIRISCGVATGADREYVVRDTELPDELRPFSRPTISGRQLSAGKEVLTTDRLLLPYNRRGELLPEAELGPLGRYLAEPERRARLLARTCARVKPWYAFHETPPLVDVLRPKLLCKDITSIPYFFADEAGTIVPRHSVYYVIPRDTTTLRRLATYLNSPVVRDWLQQNCQRAANGFLRLQSHVLKQVPVPNELVEQPALASSIAHSAPVPLSAGLEMR